MTEDEKKDRVFFAQIQGMQFVEGGIFASVSIPWPPSPEKLKDDASEDEKQKYAAAVVQLAAYVKAVESLHLGAIQFVQGSG